MDVILTTTHPRAQCVDLRATFAGQFRFGWDEAYHAERPDYRKIEAPWLTIILCRYGKIFPWGGRRLAAHSISRAPVLKALTGMTVAQEGKAGRLNEVIVTFDVSLIESVAELLGAKRPRVLSPEQRERQIARLKTWRFKARNDERDPEKGPAAGEG